MKSIKLMQAIGGIEDKYVEEADSEQGFSDTRAPARKSLIIRRFAPVAIAACLVIAVLFAVPALRGKTPPVTDPNDISIAAPPSGIGTDTDPNAVYAEPPAVSARPLLTINSAASVMEIGTQADIDAFSLDLTEAQISAIFPDLNITLGASAWYYRGDGSLMYIAAVETMEPGRLDMPAVVNDSYYRTEIKLGRGQIYDDVVISHTDPKTTDVYGVAVTASRFVGRFGQIHYRADFTVNGLAYRVELNELQEIDEAGAIRLTELVYDLISGTADLSSIENPEIPELRFDQLTLEEARQDPEFGTFLPTLIPNGFTFESSYRVVEPKINTLSAHWGKPNSYLELTVGDMSEREDELIVHPNEREKYDMSLYPIPLSESVPIELWEAVTNPVFLSDEISLEIIRARVMVSSERGEGEIQKMDFSVLFDNVLVRFVTKGVTTEQLWDMVQELRTK